MHYSLTTIREKITSGSPKDEKVSRQLLDEALDLFAQREAV